jgi:hypothetical protein
VIATLSQKSGGVPAHLDRLIESLQVTSLSELDDLQDESDLCLLTKQEPVPADLVHAVKSLTNSDDRYSIRSLRLLKALTVLSAGESLERLKKLYPNEPFHPRNATELLELGLLEAVSITSAPSSLTSGASLFAAFGANAGKILRVPRQVRDYVRTVIDDAEQIEIVVQAATLLFGRKWRNGAVQFHQNQTQTDRLGPSNEQIVLKQLLQTAILKGDQAAIARYARLAVQFFATLTEHDRFREVYEGAHEFSRLLQPTGLQEENIELQIMIAESARMISRVDEAIEILEPLATDPYVTADNSRMANLAMDLVLAYFRRDDDKASAWIDRVKSLVSKNSSEYMQCESLLLEGDASDQGTRAKLYKLCRKARREGHTTVANNTALHLAATASSEQEAAALVQEVISSKGDFFNVMNAVIVKAQRIVDSRSNDTLSRYERTLLEQSYSYLYSQRLGTLFNNCHRALWGLMRSEGVWAHIVRLFRFSSFIWRMRGEETIEKDYLAELNTVEVPMPGSAVSAEMEYLERRKLSYGGQGQ